MSNFRFKVGDSIMCNFGKKGWKLGKVIALHYREDNWPIGKDVPYQVILENEHTLIYVPEDDARFCRKAYPEDIRISSRSDALATLPTRPTNCESEALVIDKKTDCQVGCSDGSLRSGDTDYRSGRCYCCHSCPRNWSTTELFSEHYLCAARNKLKITRHSIDLGKFSVGDFINCPAGIDTPSKVGFMQSPTLVRLPPGIFFTDDGLLKGEIKFDPHRDRSYKVKFVAVSTANWNDTKVGIVRLEVNFLVEGNQPSSDFNTECFMKDQQQARTAAQNKLSELGNIWQQWEYGELSNAETCDQMSTELHQLRELLELHPRLDDGWWWAQLGGFHMNVHKLLENKLFECELYLGYALTFDEPEVRHQAEMNLKGCYQKRLLEAARFMWIDGIKLMMKNDWSSAAELLMMASSKKDGWGWAVNHGDIWISEANARLIIAVEFLAKKLINNEESKKLISEVERLLELAAERTEEAGAFGSVGHPWTSEILASLASYRSLQKKGLDTKCWLEELKLRTNYWCAQVLAGVFPFPPKPKPRSEPSLALIKRLPGHNKIII